LLAKQEWQKARVEREGSVESRFARFVPKLKENGSKLGVHFLLIGSVKFSRSLALGNACGCQSLVKKSRLSNKLVSIIDQDVLQSPRIFGPYLLVVGARLFAKNGKCITNDRISSEKEQDWDFWDSPCNDRSSELDDVVGGRDATRKHHDKVTDNCVPSRHRS
jgi:hypothetical protein